MRTLLLNEIKNEKPNSSALGGFNSALAQTNRVMENGLNGGETREQVLAYFKVNAKERSRRSKEAFDKPISLPNRKYN